MRISAILLVACVVRLVFSGAPSDLAPAKKTQSKAALEAEFRAIVAQYYAVWSMLDPDKAAK